MEEEEKARKKVVQCITDMLMTHGFTFEYAVKKNPKGIKIIQEVTQEELDAMIQEVKEKKANEHSQRKSD